MDVLQRVLAIKEKIALLKEKDKKFRVSGSARHQYQFNPTLPEEDAETFEKKHGVKLPEDYRLFLTKLGNGGAGPYKGICSLEKGVAETHPRLPFKWRGNDLIVPILDFDDDENEEFDERRGIVFICGGESVPYEYFLVVNGKGYGEIWEYYPDHSLLNSTRKSFLDFYNGWLDKMLKQIANEPIVEMLKAGMSKSQIIQMFDGDFEGEWQESEFEYPKNTKTTRIFHKNVGANFDLVDDKLVRINKTI